MYLRYNVQHTIIRFGNPKLLFHICLTICYNQRALRMSGSDGRWFAIASERKVRTLKGSEPDNVRAFVDKKRATTSATENRPATRLWIADFRFRILLFLKDVW